VSDKSFHSDDAETATDRAVEAMIAIGGLDLFPVDTRNEVERILAPGQAVEPSARSRFVDAARRGTHARSASRRPLERLLFESRRAVGRSLEDVATGVGVDIKVLAGIERGETRITMLNADLTARWIGAVEADAETAVSALTASLVTSPSAHAYAARQRGELNQDDADYVAAVRVALGLTT
jgi:transcriptional regulator with XRE-family HTH domain